MSRIPPLYFCPDCEGHNTFLYAGKIIAKVCSACKALRQGAKTGSDRVRESDRPLRQIIRNAAVHIDTRPRDIDGNPSIKVRSVATPPWLGPSMELLRRWTS